MTATGHQTSGLGIDLSKVYFREEIALLWGRGDDDEPENQRRWFKKNFLDRGLRAFKVGNRIAVHGAVLSEWVRYNSRQIDDE